MGIDHGVLFQGSDRARCISDQIDYAYYDENPNDDELAVHEAAFVRPLAKILPRLDLLGYSLQAARAEYDGMISDEVGTDEDNGEPSHDYMSFDEFCTYACRRPLRSLSQIVDHEDEEVHKRAFPDDGNYLARLPFNHNSGFFWSEASYFGSTTCILSAYSMLQVFGTDASNQDAEVVWQYGPIADAGWVDIDAFEPGVPRSQRVLVATEGTSDARIIKHALDLIHPVIADFFRFIDVDEAHPFPGTGGLFNFAKGLVSIDVQNQVIFLLDNDAEGVETLRKMHRLAMPSNMRAMLLPDLDELKSFPARGPEGVSISDINGRAAAIECYLDLRLDGRPPAQVLWSNYKKDVDAWQGALEYKTSYMEPFLKLKPDDSQESCYDMSKIEIVLQALISEATRLVSQVDHPSSG